MGDRLERDRGTAHEVRFGQWWGRYVIGLTDEEIAGGGASITAMHAAEAAWRASTLLATRSHQRSAE